jgi:hypothetical protein
VTPHASGIPLHAQNAIVGRFLGLQVLAPSMSWIESHGHRDAADRLYRRLCWLTNESLDEPNSRQALDHFLSKLVSGLQHEMSNFSDGAAAVAGRVLDDLAILIAAYNTAPYDPLVQLADAVAGTAAEYYRTFGVDVPDHLWQSTHPRFSYIRGQTGLSFAGTIHVQLWTEFGIEAYPTAQVLLKIAPRWLDEGTVAALPRSLLHEYVAHVPQGPYSRKRIHPDPSDLFAEGWMDYIAHRIFIAVLEERGPSVGLGDILDPAWALLQKEAAERFFMARCSLADNDGTAAARREGVQAAQRLHDVLRVLVRRRLLETDGDADDLMYRLSFSLNVSELDNLARAKFAAKVQLCLRRWSRLDTLVGPLRDWAATRITSTEFFECIIDN